MMNSALTEIVLLSFFSLAVLADLFLAHRIPHVAKKLCQVALLIVVAINVYTFGEDTERLFTGLYITDDLARLLKIGIAVSALFTFIYSRNYIQTRLIANTEFHLLSLVSVMGMCVLVSAHSLLTIYLGLELMSLPLYGLVALGRENSTATEAAMKYFVMGALASGFILYGMSMLYGATGSLDIRTIAELSTNYGDSQGLMLGLGLVFLVAGIGFKLAAAPFHMWAPDVYTGAPTAVTLFLSTAPKLAAFGMALRVFVFGLPSLQPEWQQLLMILAVLSIGLGNLFAIVQTNIKRLLAYSAVSHAGYLLLGIIAGTSLGYGASLFYVLIYALMSLAAFGLLVLLSKAGFDADNIDDLKGLNQRNPWLAFMMLLILFSLAGVPPLVGFFAKLAVLQALVDASFIKLAIYSVLMAVVGAFYYIRIIKTIYFDNAADVSALVLHPNSQLAISFNSLLLLVLGFLPSSLVLLCQQAFH